MVARNSGAATQDHMGHWPRNDIKHRHQFSDDQKTTIIKDEFEFGAPLGLLGRIAEILFLTSYMKRFLLARNDKLKQLAESDQWMEFVD